MAKMLTLKSHVSTSDGVSNGPSKKD
ncbi:hypothetical protein CCACVL1_13756 [Corchorus capsularis]|uniref:Uncharacterized protein n=1 Tax=Corchorus capsularis TaxID=210143 RepID=A0A1R3I9S7_COCAP|nr:hypothetical protein CCACVL1_13756 [Corchorus capsularis]